MGRLSRRMEEGGDHPRRLERPLLDRSRDLGLLVPPSLAVDWLGGRRRFTQSWRGLGVSYGSGYHVPVMVNEVLHYLRPERGGLYLDGTLGGGGHAEAILEVAPTARLIGVDRDPDARGEAARRLARFDDRFMLVAANFAEAVERAWIEDGELAGVLLDLGISSHQVDEERRGFTFRPGAPLDMRMDATSGEETAADYLNEAEEEDLAAIFYRYGEERRSRRLARIIVEMREKAPFERSDQLVEAIERAIPRAAAQDRARIFQALRIAVNAEMEGLERALPRLRDALAPGGVMVVLSYHSLEDRLVKDAFREWSRDCVCPPGLPICRCRGVALGATVTRKPVMAGAAEVEANPRARSARLRAWRKA
jgi:16S rRNA (cytosine1402-N4)-methyltransferase